MISTILKFSAQAILLYQSFYETNFAYKTSNAQQEMFLMKFLISRKSSRTQFYRILR